MEVIDYLQKKRERLERIEVRIKHAMQSPRTAGWDRTVLDCAVHLYVGEGEDRTLAFGNYLLKEINRRRVALDAEFIDMED